MPTKTFDNGNSDEARQFLLDRHSGRSHPKRHGTLKRRKRLSAEKKARIKAKNARLYRERSKFLAQARDYWRGLAEGHP